MKVLRTEKFWKVLVGLALAVSSGVFLWLLTKLNVLPDNIQIPAILAIILIVVVIILLQIEFRRSVIISRVLLACSVILVCIFGLGGYYVYRTDGALSIITAVRNTNTNKVSFIVKQDSEIQTPQDLSGKKIVVLKSIDKSGTETAVEQIKNQGVQLGTIIEVDSVPQQIMALSTGEADAMILNEAYRSNILETEEYARFSDETRVVFQASFLTDSSNEPLAVSDVTTKPYNILISGNDTYGDVGELSRSDVNMVVTVNPLTSTVLLTSIPRDSYVAVDCGDAYSCAEGQQDKITHTGINGITSTKQTIEKLLNIDINYTFRVNFSSVTNIVDSLGGIDIEVPEGQAVETFYADSTLEGVTEGWNHLDGARALSFARERYAYIDGDNQRVRNQQMVLKAIFGKATSPNIIINYPDLLSALQSTFDTNLTQEEITSFIRYQIQSMPEWKFESYQLSGEGAMLYCPSLGQEAYVTVLDQTTIDLAHDKIMAVLSGKSAEEITYPTYSMESEANNDSSSALDLTDGSESDYFEDTNEAPQYENSNQEFSDDWGISDELPDQWSYPDEYSEFPDVE